jgi:hypothetical protein
MRIENLVWPDFPAGSILDVAIEAAISERLVKNGWTFGLREENKDGDHSQRKYRREFQGWMTTPDLIKTLHQRPACFPALPTVLLMYSAHYPRNPTKTE